MKKYILIFSILFSLFAFTSLSTSAEENAEDEGDESLNLAPDAKSAILIERDTGAILYDKNAHEALPPASMTKLMTLLLIMEAIDQGDLKKDEMIRISERAASMGGSQIFLEAGEEMSVEDLLKGVAVASGNDASVALAERIAGSEEAFVKKMNEKVKELGLENTKFQNTTGLPVDDHYSTAYDMAMVAKELLKYEDITNYTSIYEDYLRKGQENEFWLVNTNKLVRFYPGVDGLKTGYTNEAKYCLTATAEKNDMRVVAVVMGADTTKERNATISSMLDYAFNQYETHPLFEKDEVVTKLQLLKAEDKDMNIIVPESVSTLHRKGESTDDVTTDISLNEEIPLPINKGEQVGVLTVKNGEEVISEIPLTVESDVKQATYFTLLKRTLQEIAKN
ncbi:D-alanyl-D-alanine carboxypeptidase family protein [Oceanobacillus salinisoli]|uniref:D-alanyl-D-alanine carboxypeptidase family protein n=1 Tax=Oceanobacillus salinisoli TaxID=2678611 RepID=UPI0012E2B54C|nr:D-alanyl-D-alanine carboxypeptidase family protein [Oceanobacillus salinisoli]